MMVSPMMAGMVVVVPAMMVVVMVMVPPMMAIPSLAKTIPLTILFPFAIFVKTGRAKIHLTIPLAIFFPFTIFIKAGGAQRIHITIPVAILVRVCGMEGFLICTNV